MWTCTPTLSDILLTLNLNQKLNKRVLNIRRLALEKPHAAAKNQTQTAKVVPLGDKPVCFAFQKGTCTRGDACRFYHPPAEDAAPGQNSSSTVEQCGEEIEICRKFLKGQCRKGPLCRFSHGGAGTDNLAAEAVVEAKKRIQTVCFAFQKGRCERGSTCKFLHEEEVWACISPLAQLIA